MGKTRAQQSLQVFASVRPRTRRAKKDVADPTHTHPPLSQDLRKPRSTGATASPVEQRRRSRVAGRCWVVLGLGVAASEETQTRCERGAIIVPGLKKALVLLKKERAFEDTFQVLWPAGVRGVVSEIMTNPFIHLCGRGGAMQIVLIPPNNHLIPPSSHLFAILPVP